MHTSQTLKIPEYLSFLDSIILRSLYEDLNSNIKYSMYNHYGDLKHQIQDIIMKYKRYIRDVDISSVEEYHPYNKRTLNISITFENSVASVTIGFGF